MDLTGRVALVTGASSGIGEATARALAREGCAVALAARRAGRLEALADELNGAGDGRALAVPTDVTDGDDVSATVERTLEAFGGIDVLVNNAGVFTPGDVAGTDLAALRRQLRVNLEGVMNATHAALPALIEADVGDVVAVSSVNAREPAGGASAYTASKFGVDGFCRALRREVAGEGVRVTNVLPGAVSTEMRDWADVDGRVLDPSDVAETVVFAVSRPDHVALPDLTVTPSPPVPDR
jgi:hypothetical protein